MKQNYAEERKDPRWQRMRLEIMQRDDFLCQHCYCEGKTLNVHHSYYVPGRKCWDYPAWSLMTVCDGCHEELHEVYSDHCWMPWENQLAIIYRELSIAQGRCDFAAEFAKALERGFTNVHLWDAIENYLASLEKEPVELEVVK